MVKPVTKDEVRKRNNVQIIGNPTGRPLVFAHGFGCSQEMWRFITPDFVDQYSVVLYDQVGAGASDLEAYDRRKYDSLDGYAGDLLEILDAENLHDAVFIGHSVSAMIGVLAANRDPSRFGALVLVAPSPRYLNDIGYIGGFEQADIDALLDSLDLNYLGWSSAMAPVIMGNGDRPDLAQELTASFCRTDPTIARHFARVTFTSDNRGDLPSVRLPTLVLQCSDDVIAPLSVGTYVHSAIPESDLVLLESAGHCPNLAGPDEMSHVIQRWLH